MTGEYLTEWGSHGASPGQFNKPEFVCISEHKHHLIVSDTFNHRIQVFDIRSEDSHALGEYITSFGVYGKKFGSFRFPRGVTTDAEGYIMVADWKNNRLQLFEPNGNFVTVITNKSNHFNTSVRFDRPVGVTSLFDGGLAFSNWGRTQTVDIL